MKQESLLLQNAKQEAPLSEDFEQQLALLLQTCKQYLNQVDEGLIERAYHLAHWAHRKDTRKSGEPYFYHPIQVAQIVAKDICVDDVSVAAALLHDTVEDTVIDLAQIRAEFGEEMASIIDGLTKIDAVFKDRAISRAENWRKLILHMATDMRVIMVKFADRLHNMQTLDARNREAQLRTAHETMEFFVPLAHRLGVFSIKSDLEDLCLKITDREKFNLIARGLEQKKESRNTYIEKFMNPIKQQLLEAGFEFDIKGRPKSIFSIYKKMERQGKTLDEIYDLFAIRIVLHRGGSKGKEDCWRVYSLLTDWYKPLPERFRDFISMPKSNGYQSLHTTVIGPEGKRVEIQIRTREMDDVAEHGVAAHWKYKEGTTGFKQNVDEWYAWVRDAMSSSQAENADEFVKDFRLNLFTEEIHVFTPKGDVINLPKNATPLDFAFHIHTDLGMRCTGAKVNGKMVPLSYKLSNGDDVQVLSSERQVPNSDWIKYVVTQKAKSRIRAWINEKRRKAVEAGREILDKRAKKIKTEITDQLLDKYARYFKFSNAQEMLYQIGTESFDPDDLVKQIQKGLVAEEREREKEPPTIEINAKVYEHYLGTAQHTGHSSGLIVNGQLQTNIAYQFATCCNPVRGDEVFGLVSVGRGMRIHRVTCKNAPDMYLNHSDRIMRIEWPLTGDESFISGLKVIGADRVGMINDISAVISKTMKINIRSVLVSGEDGVFTGTFVVDVKGLAQLEQLMSRLRSVEGVQDVYRFEGGKG